MAVQYTSADYHWAMNGKLEIVWEELVGAW
jgi:hypothetical protein